MAPEWGGTVSSVATQRVSLNDGLGVTLRVRSRHKGASGGLRTLQSSQLARNTGADANLAGLCAW
jgi:hypothetical protein